MKSVFFCNNVTVAGAGILAEHQAVPPALVRGPLAKLHKQCLEAELKQLADSLAATLTEVPADQVSVVQKDYEAQRLNIEKDYQTGDLRKLFLETDYWRATVQADGVVILGTAKYNEGNQDNEQQMLLQNCSASLFIREMLLPHFEQQMTAADEAATRLQALEKEHARLRKEHTEATEACNRLRARAELLSVDYQGYTISVIGEVGEGPGTVPNPLPMSKQSKMYKAIKDAQQEDLQATKHDLAQSEEDARSLQRKMEELQPKYEAAQRFHAEAVQRNAELQPLIKQLKRLLQKSEASS